MNNHLFRLAGLALIIGACLAPDRANAQGFGGGFGGGNRRSSTSGNYPSSTSMGQATFMSDPETRKVIAVTDPETAKFISQIITNLDRPAPQVLIKCVFVEATYNKSLDLGIEGNYTKNLGTANNGQTGVVNQVFGLAQQGTTPAPPGAGIYQILGNDYQATIRAIAQAGKAELLSRPSILARNNQQATISLGQEVPIPTNTRYDTFGNQISSVEYRNVGIILTVTPFITRDGMVEMVVAPQTSELADKSQWVPIASGSGGTTLQPVINSRTADTVVVVPDGQTAVIGGLMQKIHQTSESKIPFLGDIPGLGVLFKRTQKSDTKQELLIFLTPHIVHHPSELAAMSTHQRESMQMPRSFEQQELDRFLDNLPVKPTDPNEKKK
jgi:type II secretion system protein D